jgi:hypothetical protein
VLHAIFYYKFRNQDFLGLEVYGEKVCNTPLENLNIGSVYDTPTVFLNCVGLDANYELHGLKVR